MTEELNHLPDRRPAEMLAIGELLAEDLRTHDNDLLSPGFWAVSSHRLGRRAASLPHRWLRGPARAAHSLLATAVDWTWGIQIPIETKLGRRVRIWHFGSLLLNARSIGDDVHIRHDTTFDAARRDDATDLQALPVIEDHVDVGSGACVIGAVTVGRGARVGANTVVMESVPPGATVFGVPSRVLAT